jgi:hypothetical protein
MRFSTLYLSLVIMTLIFAGKACFADELIIEPDQGFVNEIINSDTTATGERTDPNRVYVLRRDAQYYYNGRVVNLGWKLAMAAEQGQGSRPLVTPFPDENGEIPSRFINASGDLELTGLSFDGAYEDYLFPDYFCVGYATDCNFIIDDCCFCNTAQGVFRLSKGAKTMKVTNSLMLNMGNVGQQNMGNGRFADMRDASYDTLIVRNTTMINNYDRIFRHRGGSGVFKYGVIDHCTIIDNLAYHGMFELGNTGDYFQLTNTLFINPMIMGNDPTDSERLTEFDAHGETNADGIPIMYWIANIPNDSTEFQIHHNYFSYSPELESFFESQTNIDPAAPVTDHIKSKLDDPDNAFIQEAITLKNRTDFGKILELLSWYFSPEGANKSKVTTDAFDYDRASLDYFTNDLDCSYDTSLGAYTGAEKQLPVGDLNWFPEKLDEWITEVKDTRPVVADNYSLLQNYPNPFNPSTTIHFSLQSPAKVSLVVYNTLGKEVRTLWTGKKQSGSHSVHWDGRNDQGQSVAGGVYFYRLMSDEGMMTKKMVLLK